MPVAGLVEAGPDEPMQPPTTFGQITKIALGIDRPAGADHGLPPAGLAGDRMLVDDVLIAGQRMADQNRIAAVGIERAVGLIGDLPRREIDAGVEPQRLARGKAHHRRMRHIRFAGAVGKIEHGADVGHYYILGRCL